MLDPLTLNRNLIVSLHLFNLMLLLVLYVISLCLEFSIQCN